MSMVLSHRTALELYRSSMMPVSGYEKVSFLSLSVPTRNDVECYRGHFQKQHLRRNDTEGRFIRASMQTNCVHFTAEHMTMAIFNVSTVPWLGHNAMKHG